MKSFCAYALGVCAVSVTVFVSEPVDAGSKRGVGRMGHGPVVSHSGKSRLRGLSSHRQGFRSGVTLPHEFRGGVNLPRDFRSGVTLRRSTHGSATRHKNRVSRNASVKRHEGKRRRSVSSSRHREKSRRVAKGSHKWKSHTATKHYRKDKSFQAKSKRYEVVDWKPGDRRYSVTTFASSRKNYAGHKRHRGKKRFRVENWRGKNEHYGQKRHRKHKRHRHVFHSHHHRRFSAAVYYAVPRTEVYVVNAYEEDDDCRVLTELGHDASGRPARVEWTLCFDEYGEPYIPEDGRPVVTLY